MKINVMNGLALGLLFLGLTANASGVNGPGGGSSGVGGGGDADEIQFSVIENDLRSWIVQGGANYLNLPTGVSTSDYNSKMLSLLAPRSVVVSFTDEVILVGYTQKTCRGYLSTSDNLPHVTCNVTRFRATDLPGQYKLVHHEIAGLAGLEQNAGAASDYQISGQIITFLEPTSVLRLVVTSPVVAADDGMFSPAACTSGTVVNFQDAVNMIGAGNSNRDFGTVSLYARKRSCNAVTGCGAWAAPYATNINFTFSMITGVSSTSQNTIYYRFYGLPFQGSTGVNDFQFSTPHDGGYISWNGSGSLGSGDYYSYVRGHCAKMDFLSADRTLEEVAYFTF